MGADMTEGTLVKWLKNEGDPVERGEIIAEIETDKANVEIEAFESGIFRKAIATEGDLVEVGGVIGIIAASNDDISQYENGVKNKAATPPASKNAPSPEGAPSRAADSSGAKDASAAENDAKVGRTSAHATESGTGAEAAAADAKKAAAPAPDGQPPATNSNTRMRASPVARRLAEDAGIDLRTIIGSGPDGRVIKRDIEAAIGRGAPGTPQRAAVNVTNDQRPTTNPRSKMRQAIARRMSQSKREAPHYYLLLDIDMTDALEIRAQYNAALESGEILALPNTKVSINDMLVRATALALRKHPEFNATIAGDAVTQHPQQNICIAISVDDGLIAPAIIDAGAKPLTQIAAEAADLIARAKGGKLRPAEINDGTFTITNLGAYGVETLIGIIQPPQTAILGVGSVMPQAVARDGQVAVRQVMKVALSADHRATDGAQGAQFLSEFKRLLENPLLLVL
jgi:pyruvate dehydrogenase E2 component (dihydrolipoamide acetyltransferase)